jgi:DNA-binding beta-propeller fold protein YncE
MTVAGAGTGATPIAGPVDLALTGNGILYEAEWGGNRVQAFAPNNPYGILSQSRMGSLRGICMDNSSSNYYVTGDGSVTMWPSNTTIMTLSGAFGIAKDRHANLYVSSEFIGMVICWNATSNTSMTVLTGLNSPRHLYLDEANQLIYDADRSNHRVIKGSLNGGGNFTVVSGGNGNRNGADQLSNPNGVFISKKTGAVYIADTGNNRIQKWMPNARSGITVIGYPNGTSGNGLYSLNGPYAVALDASEAFLYVADFNNNRVQRVSVL